MEDHDDPNLEPGWTIERQNRLKGLGVSRPQLLALMDIIGIMGQPPATNPLPTTEVRNELEQLNAGLIQALRVLERFTIR